MTAFRVPTATYRLQFSGSFKFAAAGKLVRYLHDLGITDMYASPLFKARRGSRHGYSVTNPMELNPELGPRSAFETLVKRLKARDMGLLIDIVPNHMALSPDNPWWMDVIENGPNSPYANFFDIDWHPPSGILDGQVFLPILGSHYGQALEAQELKLSFEEAGFCIHYYAHRFPLGPKSYARILSHRLEDLAADLGEAHPAIVGLRGLLALVGHLPEGRRLSRNKIRERQRDQEIIKKTLWLLYQGTPEVRRFVDENLAIFNGSKADPESFDQLDGLLGEQAYRLAFWRVALEMNNYRRFFSINDLIGIRIEDPRVFEAFKHGLLFDLIAEGKVTGVRTDHIDGLHDPLEYLQRLQNGVAGEVKPADGGAAFYIVVEKILAEAEVLPSEWPVSGTTGYDFLNRVNGLFIEEQGHRKLREIYADFTGRSAAPGEVIYEKKKLVMEILFGGEIEALANQLYLLASRDRWARDVSRREVTASLVEVTACLPVYRTYTRNGEVAPRDRRYLEQAISAAKRRDSSLNPLALDFVKRVLFLDFPTVSTKELKDGWLHFVMRWQQLTGPIMAKGLEDTALYNYNPLVSMNEVGGSFEPMSVEKFHELNRARLESWPSTLNATSTHDTKRSEDVRTRISTLSEVPEQWQTWLHRWSGLNAPKKLSVGGQAVPDPHEEVLLYQTLLGAWPLAAEEVPDFKERLKGYTIKAAREAQVHTRWVSPDADYEKALLTFVDAILDEKAGNEFLDEFLRVQERIAYCGAMSSLAQVLLKTASPGLPDFYQGTELWDFSLVDPDNRRPVDFQKRVRLLKDLDLRKSAAPGSLVTDLLSNWRDGRIKLYLTSKALRFRREHKDLFLSGDYLPLTGSGSRADNVIAFSRRLGDEWIVVAASRFMMNLTGPGEPLVGPRVWGTGTLNLHPEAPTTWVNVGTGEALQAPADSQANTLPLHEVFSDLPVALLFAGSGESAA
jgi:(1->4)-alpha-D-glucan 1-alpha-D-glucosylmutase